MNAKCQRGIHNWRFAEKYDPSIDAEIITHVEYTSTCARCGKVKKQDMYYDPITRAPIDNPELGETRGETSELEASRKTKTVLSFDELDSRDERIADLEARVTELELMLFHKLDIEKATA